MGWRLITILILLFFCNSLAYSQDTLTKGEISIIEKAYSTSQMTYLGRAIHFSQMKDTAKASEWFVKVNPYLLFYEWRNTTQPDTFLEKYLLTEDARKQVNKKYLAAYNAPKSASYSNFDKMADEDQQIRFMLEHCDDKKTIEKLNRKLRISDSVHFMYLYSYVKTNGWPSLENGSMPATLLAIHDHIHHTFYFPYLKKAVIDGQADYGAVQIINTYFSMKRLGIDDFKRMLDTSEKISFDISNVLNDKLPLNMSKIVDVFHNYCGQSTKIYIVFETTRERYEDWMAPRRYQHERHILSKFMKELRTGCPERLPAEGVWEVSLLPSNKTRMTFHLILK